MLISKREAKLLPFLIQFQNNFPYRHADFETFLCYSQWKLSPELTNLHFTYITN